MEKLYRQHVLKEAPGAPVIQIQGLKKAPSQKQSRTRQSGTSGSQARQKGRNRKVPASLSASA